MTNILCILSSARTDKSISRKLAAQTIETIKARYPDAHITIRDVTEGLPVLDDITLSAFNNKTGVYTPAEKAAIAPVDALLDEFLAADILLIAAPVYNFSVPAALKAWFDLIARPGKTFRYKPDGSGFESLVPDKKTCVLYVSGGSPMGAKDDFASPLITHFLNFLGIRDIRYIEAAGTALPNRDEIIEAAEKQIAALDF